MARLGLPPLGMAILLLILPATATAARDSTVTVPGGSNLWLAGGNPAPGDGPGSAPPSIKVPDGATAFTIVKVTGLVSCCTDEPNIPPDGGGNATSITPTVGSIGPYSGPSNLPLLGLFLEGMPTGTAPGDLPGDNTNDFGKISPKPKQPFFIGDGRKGDGGKGQTFGVPKGATRLFLGIPDSYGFVGAPQKYEDNNGAFKATLRWKIPSKNATISGRVVDSFGDGVGNVKIIAKPAKGKTRDVITPNSGFFEFTFAKPANEGTVELTPKPLGDDKVKPDKLNVAVKPGKESFAKFTAEVGILQGKVFELICPGPFILEKCRDRVTRKGANVVIDGSGIRKKKFDPTDAKGSYKFRVPPGTYKVQVEKLDVSGTAGKRGSDVCKENKAKIPVPPGKDPDQDVCKKIVEVHVKEKEKEATDFVAVPRRVMTANMDFLTFERGKSKPRKVNTIKAGLVDPVEGSLFGVVGDKGDDYPTTQCRTGCALIEIKVRDLLARPVEHFGVDPLAASEINPNHSVSERNTAGRACLFGKKFNAGKPPSFCAMSAEVNDDRGRALGVYAAPGVVAPSALQEAGGVGSALVGAKITSKARDDVLVTEPITVRPNRAPGVLGTVALKSGDADYLNFLTDPGYARNALDAFVKLPPNVCEKFQQYMADKLFGEVKSIRLGGKQRKITFLNELCEGLEVPSSLIKQFLDAFDDKLLSLTILDLAKVRSPGLLEVFGVGVKPEEVGGVPSPKDAIKLIPRTTTAANGFLANWVRAWRSANGPFQAGNTFSIRIYEVSHYAFQAGGMSPQPAAYISLFSPITTTPANLLLTDDYDPFTWLT